MGAFLPTKLKATLKMVEKLNIATNHYGPITAQMPTQSLVKELLTCGGAYDRSPVASQSNVTFPSVIHVNTKCRLMLETKVFNGERYPHGGVKVQAEVRSKDHNGAVEYGEVEDHRDGTYTITLTPLTAGPHQLLLTMDGQHVQNSNQDLHVSDYRTIKTDQKEKLIKCSGIPSCVAIHDNSGDIYVGCQDGNIYVFDKTGQPKNIIGRPNSSSWKLSSICIKGDEMYVLDTQQHEVHKLTLKGELLLTFGKYGLLCPTAFIVDSSKRMIVSDKFKDRILIFDQNGSWISTINGVCKVSGDYCFKCPQSLALDPQGNIHVAYELDTIKVFTIEGTYVRWYGHPDLNRSNRSNQVAIDSKGYSLVCADNSLFLFDPQANHLHTVRGWNYTIAAIDSIRGNVFVFADRNVYKFSIYKLW